MDPASSPREHMSSMGISSEGTPDKTTPRTGRGCAIPHYIIAYKMTQDFMPRDDSGCYLVSENAELVESPLKSHLWQMCLRALHKHSASSLYKGQEIKSYPEFSKAIHNRLLQMNRQIRNHMMPSDLKVPFTKRNATALASYKSGDLYKLWQQQKLPAYIVNLATEGTIGNAQTVPPDIALASLTVPPGTAECTTATGVDDPAPQGDTRPGSATSLPPSTTEGNKGHAAAPGPISTKEVMALLNWGKGGNRSNSSDQSATTDATPPKDTLASEVELQALRFRVKSLEKELQVTKEELAIQQSKLKLETQHTQLLKRKYEGPCPD